MVCRLLFFYSLLLYKERSWVLGLQLSVAKILQNPVLCFAGWLLQATLHKTVVQCRVFSPQSIHFPIVWCVVYIHFAACTLTTNLQSTIISAPRLPQWYLNLRHSLSQPTCKHTPRLYYSWLLEATRPSMSQPMAYFVTDDERLLNTWFVVKAFSWNLFVHRKVQLNSCKFKREGHSVETPFPLWSGLLWSGLLWSGLHVMKNAHKLHGATPFHHPSCQCTAVYSCVLLSYGAAQASYSGPSIIRTLSDKILEMPTRISE